MFQDVTATDFSCGVFFPGGGDIFPTRPDPVWGRPSLLHSGYRVIPGGKAAGTWRYLPTPSRSEVKERVELYFYFLSMPSRHVIGLPLLWNLFTLYPPEAQIS
jgi:hypothetical protein